MSAEPALAPGAPRALRLAAGPSAVLLLHGLSSGPQELQFLARGLQRAGHSVHVPVIEGYSHAPGQTRVRPWQQWAAAALAEFDALRAQHESVAVGGLCIGAVLALHAATLRSPLMSAVLALSTTLHYDGWATPWYRRLLPLARWVPGAGRIAVREGEPYGVKDPRMRAWIAQQMREAGNSDAGAAVLRVADLLQARQLMASVRRGLPAVTAPTLLLHARRDDAASSRSAFEVAHRVSARRVRCVLFDQSYHMLSIDQEKHQVLAEMKDFLCPDAAGRSGAQVSPGPRAAASQLFHFNPTPVRSTP